jgi:hypothetical protein
MNKGELMTKIRAMPLDKLKGFFNDLEILDQHILSRPDCTDKMRESVKQRQENRKQILEWQKKKNGS